MFNIIKRFDIRYLTKNKHQAIRTLQLFALLLCCTQTSAQLAGNLQLRLETGILRTAKQQDFGLLLHAEPQLKVFERGYLGLRMGLAINAHSYGFANNPNYQIDTIAGNGVITVIPTLDYYLNDNDYRPFIGLGAGVFITASDVDVYDYSSTSEDQRKTAISYPNQFAGIFRIGIEGPRLRFGLEQSFVPKVDLLFPNGAFAGTVSNSYFGASISILLL